MKRTTFYRILFYIVGLLVLALGLTLNTKAGLGVSPIISVSYSISQIFSYNFGDTTLALYCLFVLIELLLHSLPARADAVSGGHSRRMTLLLDVLQIPLSLVFTRFLNLFTAALPDVAANGGAHLPLRLLVLALAFLCTGVGAALSLSMRIVPNPGDGIVQAIADRIGKSVGFTKNCFDLVNITVTITLGLLLTGRLVGVGIGTVLAVICVGRVIALFHCTVGGRVSALSGLR